MSSHAALASSLSDISDGLKTLTHSLPSESTPTQTPSVASSASASRQLLLAREEQKRREAHKEEEFMPLIAVKPRTSRNHSSSDNNSNHLMQSISQAGTNFSLKDTSFENARKNNAKKSKTKAFKKKVSKGSNYSDKLKAKMEVKQKMTKQRRKVK